MKKPVLKMKADVEIRKILKKIATGRADGGRPLGGEDARQMARVVLTKYGIKWP